METRASRRIRPLCAFVIAVVAVLTYAPGLRVGFFNGWWYLEWVSSMSVPRYLIQFFDPRNVTQGYRPVQGLFVLLEYSLFRFNSDGWLTSQILLHAANGVLLFAIVNRLGKNWRVAVIAALIFVASPVFNLAVFWHAVVDPLSVCFYLLTILLTVEPPVRGVYPPQQWQPGEYVSDVHNFLIPVGTPPGTYRLTAQVVDPSTAPTSPEIDLTSFAVDSATDPARGQLFVAHRLDVAMGPRVDLWGYGGLEGTHSAGDTTTVYLVWHARENLDQDLPLALALVDASGKTVAEWERPPIAFYPTRDWKKGEALKAYYDLQIPAHTAPGAISLRLTLDGSSLSLGSMQVAP